MELNYILDMVREKKEIRALVITGEGENFSAGADISEFGEFRNIENKEKYDRAIYGAGDKLKKILIPTVAEIRGYCYGGGLGLALKCDFRLCEENSQFALPAVKRGIGYNMRSIMDLVEVVGLTNARDILLTGRKIDYHEALEMGLAKNINKYLKKPSEKYVNIFLGNSPLAVEAVKAGFLEITGEYENGDLSHQKRVERCFQSHDYFEAAKAFEEKRKPQFKGI